MAEKSAGYLASGAGDLPDSEEVNVATLARLFADATNSYKYIFFLSILDILKRRKFDVSEPISFQDLIVEMLANAWYPHTYFKLSFGTRDQITKNLDSLPLDIQEPVFKFTDIDKKLLRSAIETQDLNSVVQKLRRYVPFRLIVPFFESEFKNVKNKHKGNNLDVLVPRVAESNFSQYKPLYRFNSDHYSDCDAIILHPSWALYLEKHYSIVRGWASWEWLKYMQKRNPSTPGLIYKLFAPSKRESLSKQTNYWKVILGSTDFYCIYSGQKVDIENFSLDHYIPWSFVAHDQLWNLIPTTPEINSSKSNDLPPSDFFNKFVAAQNSGLTIGHEKLPRSEWDKTVEAYIDDLRIENQDDLLDLTKLRNAYSNVIHPLITLASNQGFKTWQTSYVA